jgi:hypothetical protein
VAKCAAFFETHFKVKRLRRARPFPNRLEHCFEEVLEPKANAFKHHNRVE